MRSVRTLRTARAAIGAALVALGTWLGDGCDDGPEVISAVARGRQLFADPRLSNSAFNAYACATCHASTDPAGAAPPIAVSLFGVVDRASWWGGKITTLYDAVDFCWVYFMRGHPALASGSDDARALFEYLASLGDGTPRTTAPLTVVETIAPIARGDATRGAATFARSCAGCHGAPHTGRGRISEDAAIVPDDSDEFAAANGFDPELVVIEKVRHGSFFGISGTMPLFTREALSDEALGDLLAFLDPHLPP